MVRLFFEGIQFLLLLGFILVMIAPGCSKDINKKGYRLSEEELVAVILDIQVAKAATFRYPVEQRDSVNKMFRKQLFAIHQIDPYQFEHDLRKLETNPPYYRKIFDQVDQELEKIRIKSLEKEDDYE